MPSGITAGRLPLHVGVSDVNVMYMYLCTYMPLAWHGQRPLPHQGCSIRSLKLVYGSPTPDPSCSLTMGMGPTCSENSLRTMKSFSNFAFFGASFSAPGGGILALSWETLKAQGSSCSCKLEWTTASADSTANPELFYRNVRHVYCVTVTWTAPFMLHLPTVFTAHWREKAAEEKLWTWTCMQIWRTRSFQLAAPTLGQ